MDEPEVTAAVAALKDGEVLLLCFGKEGWLYSLEERGILRKWNPVSGEQMEWFTLSDLETLWTASSDGTHAPSHGPCRSV